MVFKIISHADIHLSLAHENLGVDSLIQGPIQKKNAALEITATLVQEHKEARIGRRYETFTPITFIIHWYLTRESLP